MTFLKKKCWVAKALTLFLLWPVLLTACGENPTPRPLPPTATPQPTVALLPTNTPVLATATPEVNALFPTATAPAPVPTPTRFPTPTPRQTLANVDLGNVLVAMRTTKVSFQTAYAKALNRINGVNNAARLVMAQMTTFSKEQTVWTFVFTLPRGDKSWTVFYDSIGARDKKELLTVSERSYPLLAEEAGQLQPSKVLDSDEITARVERNGVPPELPLDTLFLQTAVVSGQGRVPVYIFVNGPLNKQIVVNAATGQIIQNDFV